MDRTQLEDLLASLVRSGGSSLYLIAGQEPCLRIQGKLVRAEGGPLTSQVLTELTRDFLFADHRERLENGEEVEVLYSTSHGIRFRTSVVPHRRGLNLVFRQVPETVPSFADLGLPEQVGNFAEFRRGLVLLSGFFGSGRSTTLASLIDRINTERCAGMVTLEDAIEFVHPPKRAMIHQRQIGTHVDSVARGVRDASMQGADVVCINEIDTFEGLDAALWAAERGMLVVATCRGSNVIGGLTDLIALAPTDQTERTRLRVARQIRGMVAQTLLARLHDQGRVPLVEVMIRSEAVARAIREARLEDLRDAMGRGRGLGMQTADAGLRQLLNANLISLEEANHHAEDREWVTARSR